MLVGALIALVAGIVCTIRVVADAFNRVRNPPWPAV
jgi:hypothetical protein